ncbi:helix-turn-helix domain-containing protein [Streptomyces sp. NBC_01016]|uniref:PucR family transcriptional regulator n=1 Tax=Streptomyces sp. NBC_01016 TaxID=2903720 RepID=UPI00225C3356|nr:helix-turn-helix domain-containing protein [Streptomyces sp. NBC_01016]MCX4835082.1 helix-turn-helix domain-containing protein [Streptomyces sp. NBC_01016]
MSQGLWDRLERRIPAVADRIMRRYVDGSPHYQGVVTEHLHRHMAHTCREGSRLYVRMARELREPRDEELRLFRERAHARGAEGLPAAHFMEAYHLCAEEIWHELTQVADGELPPQAGAVLLRWLRHVTREALDAHQQEFQASRSEEREARRATVRALVAGERATESATRFGIRLADSYTVLALRFVADPSESIGDALGRRLAGRRKVHRLTDELLRAFSEDAGAADLLAALDPDGGLVLVPSDPDRSDQGGSDQGPETARAALQRVRQATGIDMTAGFAHAGDHAGIPSAAAQARRLLPLAVAPGEVAVLGDHLFAYHLRHESEAAPHLRSLVERLRTEPDLLTTVGAYFANDFNRRQTAQQLHVHPNTIDNRLSRVDALTGVNPRTAQGLLVLGAAMGVGGAEHRDA